MRRGELVDWLERLGYSEYEVRRLIEENVIKKFRTRPTGRAYYDREQIRKTVLET